MAQSQSGPLTNRPATSVVSPSHCASFAPFDPAQGFVVRQPPGEGAGYRVGAPGALFDSVDGRFYLVYRLRRPRGVNPDRGGEVRIAASSDGIFFEDIWSGTKDQLESPSIERCALARDPAGQWMLFVSYVDPADGHWRIDLVEADRPDGFDLRRAQPALTAADIGAEGVKDPVVFRVAGRYHMIASYAVAESPASGDQLHGTADAYNTGLIRSATGLATSDDGLDWQWQGAVFEPQGQGWDGYCSRISCLWYEPPVWIAFYDGSANVSENYEERCGMAFSHDLRRFHRVTPDEPMMQSPHATGSLRYVAAVSLPDARYFYYEMARPDGSHDLRVFRMEPAETDMPGLRTSRRGNGSSHDRSTRVE